MSRDESEIAEKSGGKSLRLALLLLALSVLGTLGIGYAMRSTPSTRALVPARAGVMAPQSRHAISNELSYRANGHGQFFLEADVNGTPLRFMVDTGATYLSLTPRDAKAIGLSPAMLHYDVAMNTARGVAYAARVSLREVRLGQLTLEDVSALVMEDASDVSLLGMSFLGRLEGYRIRDGVLTIEW
ncbi:MAG TPA: TIGR02281 family clan AA aspartic protease [Stellaceae bacterium]|nr:TIGR02281 family clan AA aspartic protease [Stellaceae bacterium]